MNTPEQLLWASVYATEFVQRIRERNHPEVAADCARDAAVLALNSLKYAKATEWEKEVQATKLPEGYPRRGYLT
ncbi:MAG: hypothetical protein RLZZ450_80 [Pseudomonadota bacterium]|jgi:hypothetical protein